MANTCKHCGRTLVKAERDMTCYIDTCLRCEELMFEAYCEAKEQDKDEDLGFWGC